VKPVLRTLAFCSVALLAILATLSMSTASALSPPVIPTPKRPPPMREFWPGPRLILPPQSHAERPIQMQTVRIAGDVNGTSATTEIDITFFNPNQQVLEGELQFPLLDGQSIAGFAMDVNGKLRDAVPVEKAKGQAVFEDIIRRRVDPGLLEATAGNNFKLRIYPLPANGTRRVVLRVSESLGKNLYRVPLAFGDANNRVGRLDLDIRVNGVATAPVIRSTTLGRSKFAQELFGKSGNYRLRETRDEFANDGALEIQLTPTATEFAQVESFEGKDYFIVDVPVPAREAAREIPNVIGLVWDSSRSALARDQAREFALLDGYFQKMRDGEVRLTRIRDVAERTESFRIRGGDWSALSDALQATPYDGATNLAAFVPETSVREYLLFSDGLSNFGDKPFAQTAVPLYAISSALKSDSVFLRHIAQRSGGRYIDLTADTATDATRALMIASTRVLRVTGADISEAMLTQPFPENSRVQIAGILTNSTASMQLTLQHPDGKQQNIDVPFVNSAPSTSAAMRWATLKVNALDAEYTLNRAEIRRLGQRFRLVTRETSLIVLDFVTDYVRFEIAPPAELRAEYERLQSQMNTQQRAERKNHLEQIVRAFEEKVKWWNHDFPKNDRFRTHGASDKERNGVGSFAMPDAMRQEALAERAADSSNSSLARNKQSAAAPVAMAPPASPKAAQALAKPDASFSPASASIRLQKWEPDAPYAQRLRSASKSDLYRIYLDEAPSFANSTAFYLDAADVFFEKDLADLGVRVLSNLAEMDLENRHILRVLAYRLMQANRPALAIPVLKKVLALSPEEPQSYRDLGLALAKNNEPQRAIDTLNEVIIRPWHNRFPEVELITLAEMNAIIATSSQRLDTSKIDSRLLKNLPLDLRAVLTWDADNTDIDLWVTDPNGERAFYRNRFTYQGGRMSMDFTGGYGPEEFSLKHAKPGKYRVEANYYGDRRQNLTGVTTLQVQLTTGFGTRSARDQVVTMRLKDARDTVFVGEFEIK
jgi:Ca-activated chloride channel homolog